MDPPPLASHASVWFCPALSTLPLLTTITVRGVIFVTVGVVIVVVLTVFVDSAVVDAVVVDAVVVDAVVVDAVVDVIGRYWPC